tara:strand:- start:40 stop:438 length:399 start_codon:yes stop_codon:yes gene_type:complete
MNKPTPFGKQTFAEYEKEVKEYKAFNLKTEKVELGLVDDFRSAIKKANDARSEGDKILVKAADSAAKASKVLMNAGKLGLEALKLFRSLEKAAKELGIDLPSKVAEAGKSINPVIKDTKKNMDIANKFSNSI